MAAGEAETEKSPAATPKAIVAASIDNPKQNGNTRLSRRRIFRMGLFPQFLSDVIAGSFIFAKTGVDAGEASNRGRV
jgi:hypothetical protein